MVFRGLRPVQRLLGQEATGWDPGKDACDLKHPETGKKHHIMSRLSRGLAVESQATAWCSDYVKIIRKCNYQLMSLY